MADTLLPLFLDLRRSSVLLVGGGSVAQAKLQALRAAGGAPRIVAARVSPAFRIEAEGLELHERAFTPSDLDGVRLVVSATNDGATNAAIAEAARRRDIWVNAVDDPGACDAYFASTLRRGPLTLAVSTGGAFPGLGRHLRRALEPLLPEADEALLHQLAGLRNRLRARLPDPERRSAVLRELLTEFERRYLPGATP
ncbi:MAG TPA: bifunctional precorrin-2 dehydrogenase/sirohydrochlorin ferrochelatase [Holophagaceae bacterium]|nr:bifunctional precorrin-2 dehydrogenase/sirohydrochlorin ferrochelatase [Holophagaceae bacterium]